mmetsp:Transcript_2088/g.3531  ORF Transcript_2088/g.3531 Transcript_2088/m.3531 type:complete len:254 (+) Transcript_2088:22-783(+)
MQKLWEPCGARGYGRLQTPEIVILKLRKLNGDELTVESNLTECVADVKWKVCQQYDLPENQLILVLGGTYLKDHLSLAECSFTSAEYVELDMVIASEPQYTEVLIDVQPSYRLVNIPSELAEHITEEEWRSFQDELPYSMGRRQWIQFGSFCCFSFAFLPPLLFATAFIKRDSTKLNLAELLQLTTFAFLIMLWLFGPICYLLLISTCGTPDYWSTRRVLLGNNGGAGFLEGRASFLPHHSSTLRMRYYMNSG